MRLQRTGTVSGTPAKKRPRSRSVFGTAGWTTFQPFIAAIFSVLASRHRHTSACPSGKLTVPALPWRVAGKLIQVQTGVPKV